MGRDPGSITVKELLAERGAAVPSLTIHVRDWLQRFATGRPLPASDNLDPARFSAIELVVHVLADSYDKWPLPQPCYDYVQEWLRQLESNSDVRVWNAPELARAFLAHVFTSAAEGISESGVLDALVLALRRLSSETEFAEFQALHGLISPQQWDEEARNDLELLASQAAGMLVDQNVPAAYQLRLQKAIRELCHSAGIHSAHPGLAYRTVWLAMEATADDPLFQPELDQRKRVLRDLLAERSTGKKA
jgi:hypothetical protein